MARRRARAVVKRLRHVCLLLAVATLAGVAGSRVSSQATLTIGNYELISSETQKNTTTATYRATLTNGGGALSSATATLRMTTGGVKPVDGTLTFGPVAAGGSVVSSDTFTITRNGKNQIDLTSFTWTITPTSNRPPVANAGPDATAFVTQTAQLDGSGSTDPDGNLLTFQWSFVSRPAGSLATLSSATAVKPTFVVDQPGSYVVRLTVNDGLTDSPADTVTITTANSPPVANAGPDQTALVTQVVTLNGSASSDVDGNPLQFSWSFVSRPSGSNALLTGASTMNPKFTVDVAGTYIVRLIVNDGTVDSAPDTVAITTQNSPPVANAGPDQSVFVSSTVTLDGSGSTDVDGNPLSYAWALTTRPAGSQAVLSSATAVRPTFVVDRPGTYVAQLVVDDGIAPSAPDTVSITTQNSPPVANAGSDRTLLVGSLVLLDGGGSTDPDGDVLTYRWSLTTRPPDSTAVLAGTTSVGSSFIVDRPGAYVVQLIVNDGAVDSPPDTVTITTTNSAPVADAGPDQTLARVGEDVFLDGSRSSDSDNQPLSFLWSLLSGPPNSTATLVSPTSSAPMFRPDEPGDYVAQLIVNDGFIDSSPDTVLIRAAAAPVVIPPTITSSPVDITVTAGAEAVFTAGATGVPTPAVQWQVSSDGGMTFIDVPDATQETLRIITTPQHDDRRYRAVFSNAGGTATTTAARLTVTVGTVNEVVAVDDSVIVNGAPILAPLQDRTVDAGELVQFTAVAVDPGDNLTFTLINAPAGAQINPATGLFTWTPTEAQSAQSYPLSVGVVDAGGLAAQRSLTITVRTFVHEVEDAIGVTDSALVNAAPLLAPLANQTVDAGSTVQFTAVAIDLGDTLIFQLVNPPDGAAIASQTGAFAWTPSVAQAPGTYTFAVVVTDSGGLSAQQAMTVTVRPFVHPVSETITVEDTVIIDAVPQLAPLVDLTVDAQAVATFTAVGIDPGDTLQYGLVGGPTGAVIAADTGVFTWTPTPAQAPGVYVFAVTVVDSAGLSVQQPITITVRPFVYLTGDHVDVDDTVLINAAPLLSPIAPLSVEANSILRFTAVATDPDDVVTFSLFNGPTGAVIDAQTGAFAWTPTELQAPATYTFAVVATDSGMLTAQQSITVTVLPFVHVIDETITVSDSVDVDPAAYLTLTPDPLTLLTRADGIVNVMLSEPAGPGGLAVALTADSGNVTVPQAVVIAEGATSTTASVTTGIDAGSFTITATAPDVAPDSVVVSTSLRSMALETPSPILALEHSLPLTVSLTEPAPTGGVTIDLSSSDSGVLSVAEPAVTIAEGQQSAEFIVTGPTTGQATLTATAPGFTTPSLLMTVTGSTLISLGSGVTVAPGSDVGLPLTLGTPAGAQGVTVTLTSTNTSIATVTHTVFIPPGLSVPAANPLVHGVGVGAAQIIATAPGYAPDAAPVTVTLSIALVPNPLNVIQGQTADAMLTLSAPAPPGGLTFDVTTDDASVATAPATVHVSEGSASFPVPVTGLVVGSTTLRASAAGITPASTAVSVKSAPVITVGDATVGKNLQTMLSGSLGAPAPAGNLAVLVTSSDPTKVLVSAGAGTVGAASVTLTVPAGSTTLPPLYVQALSDTGTVTLQITAPTYADDTSTITLRPSGFMIATNDIATTTVAANSPLGISSQVLSPVGTPPTFIVTGMAQAIRAGYSVDVGVASANPAVGVIVTTDVNPIPVDHVTFAPGEVTKLLSFDPIGSGTTTIDLATPPGFETPSSRQQISATVTVAPPISIADITVGKDLQATLSGSIGAPAPAGNLQVRITSSDPGKVLLANSATPAPGDLPGYPEITVTVPAGSAAVPTFFVQALGNTGVVDLVVTAPNYADDISRVTLRPSGFVITTPNISPTVLSGNVQITVAAERLTPDPIDPTKYVSDGSSQQLRAGLSVDVPIGSSDPAVGLIVASTSNSTPVDRVTFNEGNASRAVAFDPIGGGTAIISISNPAGFATAATKQSITATVSAPALSVGNASVGKDLQTPMTGSLAVAAPAGGVDVTIESLDVARVLLSTAPTAAGAASVTVHVNAGAIATPSFYVQALTDTGTASIRITAPGYTSDTGTITLTPSGFVIATSNFTTTTFSAPRGVSVSAQRLNRVAGNPVTYTTTGIQQQLRAGIGIVSVPIASSDPNVGNMVVSATDLTSVTQVDFSAGEGAQSVFFDPVTGGTATIAITAPSGFATATTLQQITATVTAPNINIAAVTVGRDLQTTVTISLGAVPPSPVDVVVTSNNGAMTTITSNETLVGGTTVTFPGVNSTAARTLVVQGRGLGATTLTVRAPGYNDATSTVTVNPSGFTVSPAAINTTTYSPNATLNVALQWLNPTTLAGSGITQDLRAGMPATTVPLTSSDPAVGTIVDPVTHAPIAGVTFNPGDRTRSAQFDPIGVGSTALIVGVPGGFAQPSNGRQTLATVHVPEISIANVTVGVDLQVLVSVTLEAAPPSPVAVTVTSSNTGFATLTSVANRLQAGTDAVTFPTVSSQTVGTLYVQGRAAGTTTLTVHADGYLDGTANVTINPSGFIIAAPGNFQTTASAGNTTIRVDSAYLNPTTLNSVLSQELRGGLAPVSVSITSSKTAVGTIVGTLSFTPGQSSRTVAFDPASSGTSTIAVTPPDGFSTPSNSQQIVATVNP